MKQYVIDEFRPGEIEKIKNYFDTHFGPAMLEDVYWIPMDPALYSETQASHVDCHPLYFCVHLQPDAVSCELLIRTRNRIRCDCIAYANSAQRDWLLDSIDSILERLDIMT